MGITYEPDLVLVQFCINDLNDPTFHFDTQTRLHLGTIPDAAYPNPDWQRRSPPVLTFALEPCRRLRLCALLDDALLAWRARPLDAAEMRAAFLPPDDLPHGPERRWLSDRYSEIADAASSIGARFALIVFPYRAQIEGDASDLIQGRLVELGTDGGWPTVDVLPAFRAAAMGGSNSLFFDIWHPTPTGHRVAAEAILRDLTRRGLLPRGGG